MAGRIDETLAFVPVRIAVLTVSDTRTPETDKSGDTLAARITEAGHALTGRAIVPDEIDAIRAQIRSWCSNAMADAIITTGGTGLTGRDVTVEAVRPLFDKEIDGFAAIFHQISFGIIGTSTLQSRACAGVISGVYVFCLPGSPGAVRDGWDHILKSQLDSRHRPCNFVELMPRLREQ